MPLSTRRNFKVLGIALVILGSIIAVYAVFFMQSFQYHVQVDNGGSQPQDVTGNTPFQKLVVAFVGGAMVFLGYRSFVYIPPAEREKEQVSELDLYGDEAKKEEE